MCGKKTKKIQLVFTPPLLLFYQRKRRSQLGKNPGHFLETLVSAEESVKEEKIKRNQRGSSKNAFELNLS